ncbi:hypothetical protein Q6314_26780, partial [Klebsiella pneumoniae]
AKETQTNTDNAQKKKYFHGYKKGIMKWQRMEDNIIASGIVLQTLEWSEQAKNWYYAHGGTLSPKDGTLIFNETIREKVLRLIKNIE